MQRCARSFPSALTTMAAVVSLTTLPAVLAATTIEVTAVGDDLAGNGNCTLREAIRAANLDLAMDECAAGSGADTILLPAGVYRLTLAGGGENAALSGDLDVLKDLTILGSGRETTVIDGGGLDRVLHVDPGQTQIQVVVSGLTIRNGTAPDAEDGGGISNFAGGNGFLELVEVAVSKNRAPSDTFGGGIFNAGTLILTRSEVRGNSGGDGGGIFSEAGSSLTLRRFSRITGNVAASNGGGISNGGTLSVYRTLIDGNRTGALGKGGGLIHNGNGSLKNVTLSGNTAGPSGGAIHIQDMGSLGLELVTIAGNSAASGGGIFNQNPNLNTVDLEMVLLADNAGGNCAGSGSSPDSIGYNLEDADDCSLASPGDQVNVASADIALGPLRDNGGFLPTRGLDPTSFAVDAADPGSTEPSDQRGVERAVDGDGDGTAIRDIGAFELSHPIVVNTLADGIDATPGDGVCEVLVGTGVCSLRAAIQVANESIGWKLVELGAGTYTLGIGGADEDQSATGDLDLRETLTLRGQGAGVTIVDAQDLDRVFDVPDAARFDIVIEDLTMRNGTADTGGCLRTSLSERRLVVARSLLADCEATSGGGVYLDTVSSGQATLWLVDSAVRDNMASGSGGGIRSHFDTRLLLLRSEVSGNLAGSSGGGMEAGILDLVDSTVSGNVATNGGGLFTDALTNLWSSTLVGNTADYGGGLFIVGDVILHSSIVAGNTGYLGIDSCGGNSGSTFSRGYNLELSDSCGLAAPGDQVDTDPQLLPLAENGGPTRTHAVVGGSPAIDAGDPMACRTLDQRGVPRPWDGDGSASAECDVGAFELTPPDLLFASGFEPGDTRDWTSTSP